MKRDVLKRALCAGVAVLAFAGAWMSVRTYYGRYYTVMASRGVMDERQHVQRLDRAVAYDGSYGYGRLFRADYLMKKGRLEDAEEELRESMESHRPVRAYLLQGVLQERLNRKDEAKRTYQHVLAVVPDQLTALERLAVLAYEAGEVDRVEELARRIARVDMNNPNPTYLRAVAAERRGDMPSAYRFYQKLSATGQPHTNALYDLATVRTRLEALQPLVEKR